MLAWGFLGGSLGGALVTMALNWSFGRRCTNLEWAVADLQDRASTFKGRDMAEKRWNKAKSMDDELAQALLKPAAQARRYDNDPLG